MTAASPAGDSSVRLTPTSPVALIEIDNPPVNATSQAVRAGLLTAIQEVDRNPQIEAVVSKGRKKRKEGGSSAYSIAQSPMDKATIHVVVASFPLAFCSSFVPPNLI